MNKVARVTVAFWLMKICATTLGETAGDLLSMTLNVGYAISSLILISFFLITLFFQLRSQKFHPLLYWAVIVSTSTAGTTISDYMDRSLGLGYATGSLILLSGLATTLICWRLSEKSLAVDNIQSTKAEIFYWIAILFSNTLGTALGDFLADDFALGFFNVALLTGSIIIVIALISKFTELNKVVLFWIAFVLTRPFGTAFGDFLTKTSGKGGLDLGTVGSSAVLAFLLIGILLYTVFFKSPEGKEFPS